MSLGGVLHSSVTVIGNAVILRERRFEGSVCFRLPSCPEVGWWPDGTALKISSLKIGAPDIVDCVRLTRILLLNKNLFFA
jgi:hypothetical protein